ncbi:MAG: hypothetical protein ABSG38_18540 [Spirochaetia bacterium]|jgi:hypothetical protein
MFQKLARAVVIAASLILVISRMAFSAQATIRPLQADKPSAQNVFIVSQLQIRRS